MAHYTNILPHRNLRFISLRSRNTWSGTERNSSRSGSHSNFFGSWSDLDPFLESWNGSGMDQLIRDKNQFSSSSYDNIFCKNSSSDSIFFCIGSHVFGSRRFKLGDPAFQKQARLNANIKKKLLSK